MPKRFENLDDLILRHKGMSNIKGLIKKPIKQIQKILMEKNKDKKISMSMLQELRNEEKKAKNRVSFLRWIDYGLQLGELPSQYYLDFMAEVGVWKSAMQKYIRRGDEPNAVRAAYKLNSMIPSSLTRRLKVILCEDCYTSIDLYSLIEINPLAVAGFAARRHTDGHCCRAFNEIKDTKEYEKGYDIDWLKDNYKKGDLSKIVSMLFALRRDNKMFEIENIFKEDIDLMPTQAGLFIMKELMNNSKVDYDLTLVALLRMIREGYEVCAESMPKTTYKKYAKKKDMMKLKDVDWYSFDFHTFPGRVARDMLAKDLSINKKDLTWMWWFGESSLRTEEVEPSKDFDPYYMTKKEEKYIEDWEDIREVAKEKVEYVKRDLFKLHALDILND